MSNSALRVTALGLCLLGSSAVAQPAPRYFLLPPPHPAVLEPLDAIRTAEILIAQGIEAERERFAPGAPPLLTDLALTEIAERRSENMAHGAAFSHQDPSGAYPATEAMRAQFGPYGAFGENILEMSGLRGFNPEAFAREAVADWMASPGHRENILRPEFDSSGIGVAVIGGQVFATQVFHGSAKRVRQSSL